MPRGPRVSLCTYGTHAAQHATLWHHNLQVGYATVFFWEYFGPLVLYAAVYFLPRLAYPTYR